ncbi:MAG: hypothetical protein Q9226_008008, partial [Calogaya cf. arnoldii]
DLKDAVQDLQDNVATLSTRDASTSGIEDCCIIISLHTPADVAKAKQKSPQDMKNALREGPGPWQHVCAVNVMKERLAIRLNCSQSGNSLMAEEDEIRRKLGFSQGCKIVHNEYFVKALRFNFTENNLPRPQKKIM